MSITSKLEGVSSSIPKPIIEMSDNPQSSKFVVNDNNEVALVSGNSSISNIKVNNLKF